MYRTFDDNLICVLNVIWCFCRILLSIQGLKSLVLLLLLLRLCLNPSLLPLCAARSLQYPNEKKLVGTSWKESYINLQSSHGIVQYMEGFWGWGWGVLKNKTSSRKLIYRVVSLYVNTVCMYKLKVHCFYMSLVLLNGASDGMPVVVFKTQFHIWVTACWYRDGASLSNIQFGPEPLFPHKLLFLNKAYS